MAKEFDVYFDKTTSYDIELGSKEHTYNIYLGHDFKQTDILIESIPLHTAVEPTENIYLIIDSSGVEVEVFGALTLNPSYIYLDSTVSEKVYKYENNLVNDICVGIDVEGYLIKFIEPNGSGIEMDMSAAFVVRRMRHLYDLDDNTLRSFETQTLEDLTYIIIPV